MNMKKLTKSLVALLAMTATLATTVPVLAAEQAPMGVSSSKTATNTDILEVSTPPTLISEAMAASNTNITFSNYPAMFSNNAEVQLLYLTNVFRNSIGIEMVSAHPTLMHCADLCRQEIADDFADYGLTNSYFDSILQQNNVDYVHSGEVMGGGYDSSSEFLFAVYGTDIKDPDSALSTLISSEFSHAGTSMGYHDLEDYYYIYPDTELYDVLFTGTCRSNSLSLWNGAPCYYLNPGDSLDKQNIFFQTSCSHGVSYFPLVEDALTGYNPNLYNQVQNVTMNFRDASCTFKVMVVDRSSFNFVDVQPNDWYYSAINYVYTRNIMNGFNSTTFGANNPVTRGQFATILYRLESEPTASPYGNFADVASNMYYAKAINWANSVGIVTGLSTTKFGPEESITREQMAVMMFRYANYLGYRTNKRTNINIFDDAYKVGSYATEAISWAVAEGLINGKTSSTLAPNATATRAECATIIQRFDEKIR